ncbi:glycosyltransferase family 2 protein [Azospirillum canadense]|uniref:glycosyltransferase family 2 protein n=1 Tax=Azospirillum canadense TaxID=403962 RepID=UPI002227A100|nr:glycosyltransferase family 2 protein [Azospirillum canadense]MCW2240919.1 dolichol-phosphate mannosyltransferase [Azospirillum canadense]
MDMSPPCLPTARDGAPPPMVSIVMPAYNEQRNLPVAYHRLRNAFAATALTWELVIVDDHSSDDTFRVASELADTSANVHVLRLSRNFGSHTAIACGLDRAQGQCVIIMAADLQDPPETIPALVDRWRDGAQVVWAVRSQRKGENRSRLAFSRLYYWLMRRVVGLADMPPNGADFFLLDRAVADALRQFNERNTSLLALITWMGFRQTQIHYDKEARLHGTSGWSLAKKVKLVVDSVAAFSFLPIRLMLSVGVATALLGLIYAMVIVMNAVFGHPAEGWSSLMVIVLVVGGVQMLMLGMLGEYLWRALDEARQRPRYLIENERKSRVAEGTFHDARTADGIHEIPPDRPMLRHASRGPQSPPPGPDIRSPFPH